LNQILLGFQKLLAERIAGPGERERKEFSVQSIIYIYQVRSLLSPSDA